MNVLFDELASLECNEAIEFYELELKGFGVQSKKEIKRALRTIFQYPKIGTVAEDDIRKFSLNRFPYKILYSIEENYIFVIAVAHLHRKPNYWVERRK